MSDIVEAAKAATLAYNEGDWNKLRAVVHDNVVYDEAGTGRRTDSVDALVELLQGWKTALPDSRATFKGTIADGNTVAFQIVWNGTQSGPLAGPTGTIPASNKPINVPACQVLTVEGGKISTFTHYFNLMTLLTQIGALPQ